MHYKCITNLYNIINNITMKIELDRDDLIEQVKNNFYGDTDLLINLVSQGAATFEDMTEVIKSIIRQMKTEGDFSNSDIAEMVADIIVSIEHND